MANDKRAFALQQVVGLVSNQKWEQVSSRFDGLRIELKIRRKFTDEEKPIRQFEVDKMQNLVRTFGWTADATSISEDFVTVDLSKTMEVEVTE
jgi:hypothetical protein